MTQELAYATARCQELFSPLQPFRQAHHLQEEMLPMVSFEIVWQEIQMHIPRLVETPG